MHYISIETFTNMCDKTLKFSDVSCFQQFVWLTATYLTQDVLKLSMRVTGEEYAAPILIMSMLV